MAPEVAERLQISGQTAVFRLKIGPDIMTRQKTLIAPRSIQFVPVAVPGNVASEFEGHNIHDIGNSMRSRRAQSGIEVPKAGAQLLYKSAQLLTKATEIESATTVVPVRNLTDRPHLIHADTGFFAFNGRRGARYFDRAELELLMGVGDIRVTGKQGEDWQFWSDTSGTSHGIKFNINPDSRTWIPPHPEDLPIDIPSDGNSRTFRAFLAEHVLAPFADEAPPTDRQYLTVSETTSIAYLSPGVIGVIDRTNPNPGNSTHVNCELLYGGNTEDWPFRVENVVSPGNTPPDSVVVSFALME